MKRRAAGLVLSAQVFIVQMATLFPVYSAPLNSAVKMASDLNSDVKQATTPQVAPCVPDVVPQKNNANICDENFEQYCGEAFSQPSQEERDLHDQIDQKISKEMASFPPLIAHSAKDSMQYQAALGDYVETISDVQQMIFKQLASHGISEKDFDAYFESLKADLLKRVKANPAYKNTPTDATINSIKLFDIRSLNKDFDINRVFSFYESCGIDGMLEDAAFEPRYQAVFICPGFLLKILSNQANLNHLDFLLGHELGHSVSFHALGPQDGIERHYPFFNANDSFVSCTGNRDRAHLLGLQSVKDQIEKVIIPAYNSCRQQLEKSGASQEDRSQIETSLSVMKELDEDLKFRFSDFSVDAVDSHADELGADAMGTATVAEHIAAIATNDRINYVKSQFSGFCTPPNPARNAVEKTCHMSDQGIDHYIDDGLHPPNAYRFKTFMQNPAIRAALGCPALPASSNPCTIQ